MYYIYYVQIESSSHFKTMGSSCIGFLFVYIKLEISMNVKWQMGYIIPNDVCIYGNFIIKYYVF